MPNVYKWLARVKQKAREKEITNEDIAHHFKVTPGQVSHWFTGRRGIWLDEYIELCRFILEDPSKMLAGEEPVQDSASKIIDQQGQIISRLDRILVAKPELQPDHRQFMKKMRKVARSRQPAVKKVKKKRSVRADS